MVSSFSYDPIHRAALIFQWPQDYLETGFNPGNPARVAVLSDRYSIGNMVLYSPMSFMCRRSMDGSVIAYPGWGEDDFSPGSINWVKLTNLNEINSIQLQERRKITTLEFSPQGDLAHTECTPFGARCGLWILNLETYVSEKLADVGVMGYLMWSPDGKYLAGVRYTSEAGGGGVIVIDVNTGDVVYKGSFDWWNLKAFPDSPTWEWVPPGEALVMTASADAVRAGGLVAAGARGEAVGRDGGGLDLHAVMARLAELEINELHVECGASLAGSLLSARLVDELVVYMAPTLLGEGARPLMAIGALSSVADRPRLEIAGMRRVGGDLRLVLRPLAAGGA